MGAGARVLARVWIEVGVVKERSVSLEQRSIKLPRTVGALVQQVVEMLVY